MNIKDFKHKFVVQRNKTNNQDIQKQSLVLEYTNPLNGKRKQQKAISFIKLSSNELINGVVTSSDSSIVNTFNIVNTAIITYISNLQSSVDFCTKELNDAIDTANPSFVKITNQNTYLIDIINKEFKVLCDEKEGVWAKSTYKNYRYAIEFLQNYEIENSKSLTIDDITLTFINDYERWLQKVKKYSSLVCTHRVFYLKVLIRPYLKKLNNTMLLMYIDCKSVIKPDEKFKKAYINRHELRDIFETDFSNYNGQNKQEIELLKKLKLNDIRDWLMIGVNTGQRIETLKILKDEQIMNDRIINVYQPKRKKTIPYIPFNNMLKYYFDTFKKFPPMPTQEAEFNDALRLICKLMGYNEKMKGRITKFVDGEQTSIVSEFERWELIASHSLRRSNATNANLNGDDIAGAMAILGHQKRQTFELYNQMSEKDKIDLYAKKMRENDDYLPPSHPSRQNKTDNSKIIKFKAS